MSIYKSNNIMDQPIDFSVKSPSSPGMDYGSRRDSKRNSNSLIKDDQYWQRREKNNAAAKRSRDARRQKEEQTKHENQLLKEENEKLKYSLRAMQEHVTICPHLKLNNQ